MKTHAVLILAPVVALCAAAQCRAQENPFTFDPRAPETRARRTEFYLLGQYWHTEPITMHNVTLPTAIGPNPPRATSDLHMQFDDAGMPGFGIMYNLNNHFAVDAEFTFGYPNYTLTWNNAKLTGEAFSSSGKFNITYNILKGPITPFVSTGIGYWYVDSGIPSGPPDFYAWWDYWWGYTVVGTTPTYANTYFTVNGAGGIRWDVNEQIFLRVIGSGNWSDVGHGAGWPMTFTAGLEVGFKW